MRWVAFDDPLGATAAILLFGLLDRGRLCGFDRRRITVGRGLLRDRRGNGMANRRNTNGPSLIADEDIFSWTDFNLKNCKLFQTTNSISINGKIYTPDPLLSLI
jgi:hypothetical protein